MNPANYKTLQGLQKAIQRKRSSPKTIKLGWWYRQAEWALVNRFDWSEENAAQYIAHWKSQIPGYSS